MKLLKTLRNYLLYCGIEKEEYNAIKKDAYVSNFEVWRILNFLITGVSGGLFISSCFNELIRNNLFVYLALFVYAIIVTILFFVLKKDSIIPQFIIYISISLLLLFGCLLTKNRPSVPATTFFAFLLITPLFMIDKPIFMTIELTVASIIFAIWMYYVKPLEVWQIDLVNLVVFLVVGIFIHIISNSLRIREFVLTRKINIQKDIDELTGISNKGAITREINKYLVDETKDKGIMILLDIDYFKTINDKYGHDIGDDVIKQIGAYLNKKFINGEIVGRFGGDEFIIFIKDTDSIDYASNIALSLYKEINETISLPKEEDKITISQGVAIYHGEEKNYSEVFKKADIALYKTKDNRASKYNIYE